MLQDRFTETPPSPPPHSRQISRDGTRRRRQLPDHVTARNPRWRLALRRSCTELAASHVSVATRLDKSATFGSSKRRKDVYLLVLLWLERGECASWACLIRRWHLGGESHPCTISRSPSHPIVPCNSSVTHHMETQQHLRLQQEDHRGCNQCSHTWFLSVFNLLPR